MKNATLVLALVLLPTLTSVQANSPDSPPVQQIDDYDMVPVVWNPEWHHTKHWALVVDTSHSIFGTITGVKQDRFRKMLFAIKHFGGSDHIKFCTVAFNDEATVASVHYLKWMPGSPENFHKMEMWLNKEENQGTMSYGGAAIARALRQRVKDLTVIIISDGGFTEEGGYIKELIKLEQQNRVNNGLGKAVICTIGIENHTPPGYPKPSDETCQSWMKEIGNTGRGGYFYVKQRK